jgi:enoyl-CoA hydratase/carnithine racemase
MTTVDVLVDASPLGRITLNRPYAINALRTEMVRGIHRTLTAWAEDDSIAIVLLDGAGGRNFCAGADIRALRMSALSGDGAAAEFWRGEYRLDALIARYAKPVVAVMDGIVMGGGIGLAAYASHRIVTERLRAAMPEVGIGYFPDVCATFLLARAPGCLGTHLALTGTAAGAADAVHCGLADVVADHDRIPVLRSLLREHGDPAKALSAVVDSSYGDPAGDRQPRVLPGVRQVVVHDRRSGSDRWWRDGVARVARSVKRPNEGPVTGVPHGEQVIETLLDAWRTHVPRTLLWFASRSRHDARSVQIGLQALRKLCLAGVRSRDRDLGAQSSAVQRR